jgi:hypothetical protein
MYIWIMNEYGRAINARIHVEDFISKQVQLMVELVPVTHKRGHASHDPVTRPIPLLAMRENHVRSKEDIFGERRIKKNVTGRPCPTRSNSHPNALNWTDEDVDTPVKAGFGPPSEELDAAISSDYITPFGTSKIFCRKNQKQTALTQLHTISPL